LISYLPSGVGAWFVSPFFRQVLPFLDNPWRAPRQFQNSEQGIDRKWLIYQNRES
jgi:hypothetical protein